MIIKEKTNEQITSNEDVAKILSAILGVENEVDRDKEHFWVFGLSTRNRIRYVELVSLGTLTAGLVHPREVFRLAIMKSVSHIICGHNHPSGDPEPSEDDLIITKRLVEAGKILGIEVLDHIIIGNNDNDVFSFAGRSLLKGGR